MDAGKVGYMGCNGWLSVNVLRPEGVANGANLKSRVGCDSRSSGSASPAMATFEVPPLP